MENQQQHNNTNNEIAHNIEHNNSIGPKRRTPIGSCKIPLLMVVREFVIFVSFVFTLPLSFFPMNTKPYYYYLILDVWRKSIMLRLTIRFCAKSASKIVFMKYK